MEKMRHFDFVDLNGRNNKLLHIIYQFSSETSNEILMFATILCVYYFDYSIVHIDDRPFHS